MTMTTTLEKSAALDLVRAPEGDFFDHKDARISGVDIEVVAVAFANADGGEFVVGIIDKKHESNDQKRWIGRDTIEDFNDIIGCLVRLNPTIDFRHDFLQCEDYPGIVLRVNVDKSAEVCKTSK